ncbi:unnamed protein product [Urochloa humidicola]
MSRLGDPCTRPDEESLFVSLSFDLDKKAKEWEETTLIVMAMSAPASTGVREDEAAVLHEMRLHHGEVAVSRHQPQPFLLKFANRRHAEKAATMRCIKHNNIMLNVRPWRSLESTLGVALFFRIRICLEGVPIHAWTPGIVERLFGCTCALECIDTNLLRPDDTRTIDVWAWTPNPSRIPKKLWLTLNASKEVIVSTMQPVPWQRGASYLILPHLEWIYDYTEAYVDTHGRKQVMPRPQKRKLDWERGVVNGEPAPVVEFPPFNVPPPSGICAKMSRLLRRQVAMFS